MSRIGRIISVGFALLVFIGSSISAEVQVRRVSFRGWEEALELSNGDTRVVIVPSIGRIMHYGLSDGPNILWVNPEFEGVGGIEEPRAAEGPVEWSNFGGDKVWPTPEALFPPVNGRAWPPDHFIDGSRYSSQILENAIEIQSPISEYSGVQIRRRVSLDSAGTHLTIDQRIEKVKPGTPEAEPIPLVAWSVSQIVVPSAIFFPVREDSRFPNGVHIFPFQPKAEENVQIENGFARFRSSPTFNQKVGADSGPWVAAVSKGHLFVQSFLREEGVPYPDGGCSLEVYTSPSYTELEVLSPIRRLKPGEGFEFRVEWDLVRLEEETTEEDLPADLLEQIESLIAK